MKVSEMQIVRLIRNIVKEETSFADNIRQLNRTTNENLVWQGKKDKFKLLEWVVDNSDRMRLGLPLPVREIKRK